MSRIKTTYGVVINGMSGFALTRGVFMNLKDAKDFILKTLSDNREVVGVQLTHYQRLGGILEPITTRSFTIPEDKTIINNL